MSQFSCTFAFMMVLHGHLLNVFKPISFKSSWVMTTSSSSVKYTPVLDKTRMICIRVHQIAQNEPRQGSATESG
ncbi:hypothetical protein BC940DRAFT_308542 [Gongronella butleri]|nr:hypothetical protein BC940DRAFT_308542 [Gongronella butleri]